MSETHNKSVETNQKPVGGFLIAHFKRYVKKRLMKNQLLILSLLLLPMLSIAEVITLSHEGVMITAEYEKATLQKTKNMHFLYGNVKIENTTQTVKKYSNKNLLLNIDDLQSRTYIDSVASMMIDFSQISLNPGERQLHKVYWAYDKAVSTQGKAVNLKWNQ